MKDMTLVIFPSGAGMRMLSQQGFEEGNKNQENLKKVIFPA
ncbi:hypothetical protein RGU11_15800 [Rossellomorea marisflavi]|jgi:hypothetical protein|nr:hypothetical protein [Rossellomorea marisflavi]MDR4937842.1 hypothetical protein [Rossellomorea marisflavi]